MGRFILTDVRLFAVGADLTGHSNKVEITAEMEEKDSTNYASQGWKEVLAGLGSAELSGEGQWEAGDPGMVDDASWSALGGIGPYTVGPDGAAVSDLAYVMKAMRADYGIGDAVGEIAPWSGTAKSAWPLIRGQIAHPPGSAQTATGDGTALQLGALTAGQRLYAALHVLSVAGTSTPTITVEIESDSQEDFEGSPETRLTFTGATAEGGQILRTAVGAHADDWYRASWTISGSDPSFMFVVALGIR